MSAQAERAAEWIYRGLWRVLADWFKVPEHPPVLPVAGGTPVRSFHPSRGFLRYLKFYFWIALVLIDVALLVAWVVLVVVSPPVGALLLPVFFVLIVAPDIVAYVAIHLRYDTTWYVMSDHTLRCRRGIWLICEHTVTFENVQDIHVRRGPVQYLFGIWTIVVETAGAAEGEHQNKFTVGNKAIMEGIDNPDEIRALILERVRRSRTAGLGDEPRRGAAPAGWSPAETALLREIRDELRAIA
jgi:membrane protein YdbS with pleckstrin-like domain